MKALFGTGKYLKFMILNNTVKLTERH